MPTGTTRISKKKKGTGLIDPKPVYSKPEAMKLMGISNFLWEQWLEEGRLVAMRTKDETGHWRVTHEEVMRQRELMHADGNGELGRPDFKFPFELFVKYLIVRFNNSYKRIASILTELGLITLEPAQLELVRKKVLKDAPHGIKVAYNRNVQMSARSDTFCEWVHSTGIGDVYWAPSAISYLPFERPEIRIAIEVLVRAGQDAADVADTILERYGEPITEEQIALHIKYFYDTSGMSEAAYMEYVKRIEHTQERSIKKMAWARDVNKALWLLDLPGTVSPQDYEHEAFIWHQMLRFEASFGTNADMEKMRLATMAGGHALKNISQAGGQASGEASQNLVFSGPAYKDSSDIVVEDDADIGEQISHDQKKEREAQELNKKTG